MSKKEDNKTARHSEKVKAKHAALLEVLKEEGRCTAVLSEMARLTARVLVHLDELDEIMDSDTYSVYMEEESREGKTRKKIDPLEGIYARYLADAQDKLRALGMSTDSKGVKAPAPKVGIEAFLDELKD